MKKKVIKKSSDFSNFSKVTDFLYEETGITDLEKRVLSISNLKRYATENGVYSSNELLEKLKNSKEFYQEVINIITVNETFFMRELKELNWLIKFIEKSDKKLNILSLPCSSGEEIYSILILMNERKLDLNKINLIGYDINSNSITKAKTGLFNAHSIHKIDNNLKDKYFTNIDNNYQIIPYFMTKATFKQNNIFDLNKIENSFDIVLSRNMFIYFTPQKREEAINIIYKLLKKDGIFIKGHADNIDIDDKFTKQTYGIYKKNS